MINLTDHTLGAVGGVLLIAISILLIASLFFVSSVIFLVGGAFYALSPGFFRDFGGAYE